MLVSSIINRFNHLTAFARICSAVFVHTKGFAPSFHRARKAFIAAMRWATLLKLPLRIAWLVSMPNQISTIFIQDAPSRGEMNVKALVSLEPLLNPLLFMSTVVIQNQV